MVFCATQSRLRGAVRGMCCRLDRITSSGIHHGGRNRCRGGRQRHSLPVVFAVLPADVNGMPIRDQVEAATRR